MPSSPPAGAPLVLACGLATLDVTQVVDALPGPDEKIVARSLDVGAGGPALNAAITAARLGCAVRLLTRVGAGVPAAAVRAELAAEGVEVLDAAEPGWDLAVSTVLVTASTGQRAVVSTNATSVGARGAVPRTLPASVAGNRLAALLDGVSVLLVDGHHLDLAVPAARAARAAGVLVLLDGGSWKPGLDLLLAHVDVAVLSADFRTPDGAAGLAEVHALGPAVVARSHGGGPIEVASWRPGDLDDDAAPARARTEVTSLTPGEVVDTLGAGDVLHGALLAALAHRGLAGWHGLREALQDAAAVASESVRHAGARGWTRDPAAVAALLARVRR